MIRSLRFVLLMLLALTMLTGCDAIAGIFQAGMWTGIIILLIIVALIGFAVSRMRKR